MADSDTLYRYRDAQGVEHLVQGLEEVPREHLRSAQPVKGGVAVESRSALQSAKDEVELRGWQAQAAVRQASSSLLGRPGQALGLNLPSFLLGGGLVLAVVLGVSALRRGRARTLRLAAALLCAALAAGVYLGAFRAAGAQVIEGGLTPLERARQAAEAVQRSAADRQRVLDEIDRTAK